MNSGLILLISAFVWAFGASDAIPVTETSIPSKPVVKLLYNLKKFQFEDGKVFNI